MSKAKKATDGGPTNDVVTPKKILVIRTCSANGTSHNGFCWPTSGPVECPDWQPTPTCGHGLHGLPWGEGDWSLLNDDADALWQVVEVDEDAIVKIDNQKVKFPRGNVLYTGNRADAMAKVLACGWHIEDLVAAHKDSADSSTAASSGYSSKAASSGDYSTAASSGDYSTAASSGDSSTAASSGDSSTAASSGDYSTAASSGNSSTAASSGDSSKAASSGYSSTAASSGYSSKAASSGDYSTAASSGNSSKAASSGYSSTAASSGDYSKAASSGDYSKAASSGYSSKAASSGDSSTVTAKGKDTIAMAAGLDCVAAAGRNGCLALVWYDKKTERNRIVVGYVGEDGIKPDTLYRVDEHGRLAEVRP